MGCDIHAYLEYYHTELDNDYSMSYASEIFFGRNYSLFNLLAGVRGVCGPVFAVRGVPKSPKLSFDVDRKYYLSVVDVASNPMSFYPHSNYILREDAEKLVLDGSTKFDATQEKVVVPAWHSTSYLNKHELMEVRRNYLIHAIEYESSDYKGKRRKDALDTIQNSSEVDLMKSSFPSIECVSLNATIASMIAIENSGDYKSRLVFWFDS